MMNTNHVNGLTVVSIGTGERLGSVSEILLDPAAEHVAAFAIDAGGGGGLLSGSTSETRWISASDVHAIGPDAMTVENDSVLSETPAAGEMTPVSVLVGEKVVTEGGTFVGQIASAEIDEQTMSVTGLEVSPGFFKSNKVVSKTDVITVGDEIVIVTDAVCGTPSTQATRELGTDDEPADETTIYGAPRAETDEQ
jgi:sporulation protein YlmC with PRC-barrel domain